MAVYETIFIARQELSAAQVEALAANMTDILSQHKGEVAKTEFCGLRTLAYSIKKNRKGHYVLFNIEAPAAAIKEMERKMRLNEDILRFLTVKVDGLDSDPSPLMQSKHSRDRRFESFDESDSFDAFERKGEKEEEVEGEKEGDKE